MLQVCPSYMSDSTLFRCCVKSQITHHGKQVQIAANDFHRSCQLYQGQKGGTCPIPVPIQLQHCTSNRMGVTGFLPHFSSA